MLVRILLALLLITGCALVANAQRMQQSRPTEEKPDDPFLNSPAAEMKAKMEARYLEKLHEENLGRARELARLGVELKSSFQASSQLSAEDRKKVERMEKLTKKIRNDAGGSDSDIDPLIPANLGDAIDQIQKASSDLNKQVATTPRLVVSASVIDQTNQLLQLVKYVRGTQR
jgi:hypothetical protein